MKPIIKINPCQCGRRMCTYSLSGICIGIHPGFEIALNQGYFSSAKYLYERGFVSELQIKRIRCDETTSSEVIKFLNQLD